MNSAQRRASKRRPKHKKQGSPVPRSIPSQTPASDEQPGESSLEYTVPIGTINSYAQMVAQKQPTDFPAAPVPFNWTNQRMAELLYSFSNKKPAGKYSQIISIM